MAVAVHDSAPWLPCLFIVTDEAHKIGAVQEEHGTGRVRGHDGCRVADRGARRARTHLYMYRPGMRKWSQCAREGGKGYRIVHSGEWDVADVWAKKACIGSGMAWDVR
jgi:hypothetical protein